MNNNLSRIAVGCCAAFVLFASCKKSAKTTSCSSALHGYTTPAATMYTGPSSCSHGVINFSTGAIATAGSFSASVIFTNQGAFNTSDNCYYVFGTSGGVVALYKIDPSGTTTTLTAADTFSYSAIVYNAATNKLYCKKGGSLAEISTTATTFSAATITAPIHPFDNEPFSPGNIAVDNAAGDMYFITGSAPAVFVEKYHPGASASSVVASGSVGLSLFEMRFNKNDGMLYALQLNSDTATYSFKKIDPGAGTINTVASLGNLVNPDSYSATLDPCSNRYIISTIPAAPSSFVLYHLSMTGAIVQTDTTATFYQGLNVAY